MKIEINTSNDHVRWAKFLKSDYALRLLIEGAVYDTRLADILNRHVEIGNVVQSGNRFHIPIDIRRDEYGRAWF